MKTLLLAITALPVFMNEMSFAQAGNLDPTFNKQGFVTISVGTSSSASGLAVQPDGKIVAVGNSSNGTNNDIVLLRYKPNGKPDLSFGSGGKVITDLGGNESAYSTTVLANGKILVAGGKPILRESGSMPSRCTNWKRLGKPCSRQSLHSESIGIWPGGVMCSISPFVRESWRVIRC